MDKKNSGSSETSSTLLNVGRPLSAVERAELEHAQKLVMKGVNPIFALAVRIQTRSLARN